MVAPQPERDDATTPRDFGMGFWFDDQKRDRVKRHGIDVGSKDRVKDCS